MLPHRLAPRLAAAARRAVTALVDARAVLLATALLLIAGSVATRPACATAPAVANRTAPKFVLPGLHGEVSSDSLRGRIVLVDFWASWCAPCRRSFPWLASMQKQWGDKGLVIVAINLDKDRAAAERFLARYPATFPVAFDPAGKTAETFRVAAMPTSFVLGPDGEIRATHAGFDPAKTKELEAMIAEACRP